MVKVGKWVSLVLLGISMASSAMATSAEALLSRDLRAAKKSFGQEKRLYHYFDIYKEEDPSVQAQLMSPEGRRAIVLDRVLFATSKFWKPASGSKGLFAGEGLYLAIDPSISDTYGKMLIEFRVKPEANYLNLIRGVNLNSDTVQAIYKGGYLSIDPSNGIPESMRISELTLQMILQPGNEKFRALVQAALKAENITMAEYSWRSDLDSICAQGSSQAAFVYIGTDVNLPEFSSVEMADVKRVYPEMKMTQKEYVATVESMKMIKLIKMNYDLDSDEARNQNALSIYKNAGAIHQALDSIYGCEK